VFEIAGLQLPRATELLLCFCCAGGSGSDEGDDEELQALKLKALNAAKSTKRSGL